MIVILLHKELLKLSSSVEFSIRNYANTKSTSLNTFDNIQFMSVMSLDNEEINDIDFEMRNTETLSQEIVTFPIPEIGDPKLAHRTPLINRFS